MPSTKTSTSSTRTTPSRPSKSSRSRDSHSSQSTTPTSRPSSSPRPSEYVAKQASPSSSRGSSTTSPKFRVAQEHHQQDLSPATSLYPRSSVDTYASTTASEAEAEAAGDPFDDYGFGQDGEGDYGYGNSADDRMDYAYDHIPTLPPYRRDAAEPNVRAATASEFARLFPSMDRLSIRHDEFTADGNMSLRVDTVVTGSTRRRTAIQLFHLRMYDLGKRHFSLRRYCRDSGREVCNSKRQLVEPPKAKEERKKRSEEQQHRHHHQSHHHHQPSTPQAPSARPSLQRSVTTAIKTLGGMSRPSGFRRTNSGGSFFGSRSRISSSASRPSTAASYNSSGDGDDEYFLDGFSNMSLDAAASPGSPSSSKARSSPRRRALPTNTVKLEFCNYARVDVTRRGKGGSRKRYDFAWWGHSYQWRRVVDGKQQGAAGSGVSFHLVRDGDAAHPVAHIVPESRSPNQVAADENAGGWVPPCYMWIADESVLDAMTDVADVIMATGLIALVDDCIKERWQTRKIHRIPVPLTSKTLDVEYVGPKAFMQHVFSRRGSGSGSGAHSQPPSPLRFANPISAY